MFIETSASIGVLAPLLLPVAMQFGVDPAHFGVLMVVNLALGMVTPPFGVNLFAACAVANLPIERLVKSLLPFVAVVLGCLLIITYVPAISLFFKELAYGSTVYWFPDQVKSGAQTRRCWLCIQARMGMICVET